VRETHQEIMNLMERMDANYETLIKELQAELGNED
jgi:hypothetical protein